MYRILFYKHPYQSETTDSNNTQEPVTWFDGIYNRNKISCPILFNKKRLLSSVSKEIILEKGQRFIELNLNQLLRIESTQQGSTLFFEDKTFWTTEKNIDKFELELERYLFFRVNKNHLVNLSYIERLITCDAVVTLSNMDVIPVDAIKKDKLLKFLEGKQLF